MNDESPEVPQEEPGDVEATEGTEPETRHLDPQADYDRLALLRPKVTGNAEIMAIVGQCMLVEFMGAKVPGTKTAKKKK